ncbi:LLM class flavin-dependent oxidoreductase [Variovorax sp. OV329]|uniref:LLM class flavin-dependent oxidoreductase n=1 Tax=Variovorax sp. OV329 TaxID=1882825 RepID=UPI0008EB1959|nr:LLM class flavin-dependent oxidoreductase [Variovorax sp. OV329]SFN21181.1 FMN-dependent oxidoreductase, nitrilotriacetate monooxygenase family [Variovorax sp. OV329]
MSAIASKARQLHLGAFFFGVGHHLAAWRHPEVDPRAASDIESLKRWARIAEAAKFDAIFFAGNVGLPGPPDEGLAKNALWYPMEPTLTLAALSQATTHIGLVATVSATYLPPYHLARKFATLDQLSGGRSGWNLVTSGSDFEARSFGLTHAHRYARAGEYVQIVKGLWDTWEDDAFIHDKAANRFFDPQRLHRVDFEGEHFRVAGGLQTPRSPQGHPVIVQAGSSDDGQDLAAASAELVFTAQQTPESAAAFYRSLKGRLPAFGRSPDSLKILPGLSPFVGRSEQEAREKFEQLQGLIDPVLGVGLLSTFLGNVDLSAYPLDGPFPQDLPVTEGWKSRAELFKGLARSEGLSIRQLYERMAGARGHWTAVGTPETIADQIEHWFKSGAADGFNILAPTLPSGLEDFARLVVPELQRRGLFRREYAQRTLRGHLGLPRPENVHARTAAALGD